MILVVRHPSISSTLTLLTQGEKKTKEHGQFKCFMDHDEKKFYIEIATTKTLEALTRSALLNLLTLAEQVGSEKVYVCLRKTLGDISKSDTQESNAKACLEYYLKTFMFIGFKQLTEEEQKEISMTQTHYLLSYDVRGEEEY